MNYLKTSLRVRLGLSNPYKIKPEFKMFPEATSWQAAFTPSITNFTSKLTDRSALNKDYHVLRFDLPEENKCAGLHIGQYIWIELPDGSKRPYVPISRIDELGYLDILLRDLSRKNVGSFTEKLLQLPLQSQVKIVGPGTQFLYRGYGQLAYMNQQSQPTQKRFKNIGIITHSSAITTTYSLIESVAINHDNSTGISLLWLGDEETDFMLLDELIAFQQQYKLNMNLMLMGMRSGIKYGVKMKEPAEEKSAFSTNEDAQKQKNKKVETVGWLGPYGKVMDKHIKEFMPFPDSNEIIIMSGLDGELSYIPDLVKSMGYKDYLKF